MAMTLTDKIAACKMIVAMSGINNYDVSSQRFGKAAVISSGRTLSRIDARR